MLTQPSEGSGLDAKSALRGSVLQANSQSTSSGRTIGVVQRNIRTGGEKVEADVVNRRSVHSDGFKPSWVRGAAIVIALTAAMHAIALQPPTDAEVRKAIIQQSIAAYNATGHPCACPYQSDRAGRSCGGRSAYSRPGGASPLCYSQDVTDRMVADWRRTHH
jgi:hypothetical protein